MNINILSIRDTCRTNLIEYTRKAFGKIPYIDEPQLLDLGCGTGATSLQLAELTNGNIVAVDEDKDCIDFLNSRIKKLHLENKIETIHSSVFKARLPEKSFDIIWAEGILNIIGFEKGLAFFRPFLKDKGYYVVHDDIKNEKIKIIQACRYKIKDSFELPADAWWKSYYSCLQKKLQELADSCKTDSTMLRLIQEEKQHVEGFLTRPETYHSMFCILQKDNG
ncbi:MAG: class I SAM-dependent methyltransferase [Bacteroidales bacterium]